MNELCWKERKRGQTGGKLGELYGGSAGASYRQRAFLRKRGGAGRYSERKEKQGVGLAAAARCVGGGRAE